MSKHPLAEFTLKKRGYTCEFCGVQAMPKPGAGKQRYRHKCPHGLWCERGTTLNGVHSNWPTCPECLKEFKARLEQQQKV